MVGDAGGRGARGRVDWVDGAGVLRVREGGRGGGGGRTFFANSYARLTSSAWSSLMRLDSELGRIMALKASPVDEKVASSTPVTRAPVVGSGG